MIHLIRPKKFKPKVEGAGILLESKGKLLLLKRGKEKDWAKDKWSIPGGKKEGTETPHQAVIRETLEESGVKLGSADFICTLFIKFEDGDGIFHVFRKQIDSVPEIILSEEHTDFGWYKISELILGKTQSELAPSVKEILNLIYRS